MKEAFKMFFFNTTITAKKKLKPLKTDELDLNSEKQKNPELRLILHVLCATIPRHNWLSL